MIDIMMFAAFWLTFVIVYARGYPRRMFITVAIRAIFTVLIIESR